MTTERFENALPDLLLDLYLRPDVPYRDDLLRQTAATSQRPAWTFPERWLPMADIASRSAFAPRMPLRLLAVALLIFALLVSAAVFVGSRQTRLPPPFGPAANGVIPYSSGGDIYVGDPITGETRLLVGGLDTDELPQFSPDGTKVAFIRAVPGTTDAIDIFVVRADGSDLRRVTPEPIDRWEWITWTPDGRHIAAIHDGSRLDRFDAGGSGSVEHVADVEGMDFIQFRPPGGAEILYRALVDGKLGLFAMDADGTNVRTIVEATVPGQVDMSFSGATYSADGSQIFYERGDESGCCRLWVVDADGTDAHEFLPRGEAWDGQAVVSPDGTRIAYWHVTDTGHITVVRADGTGPVIETGPRLSDTAHWVWSPDSSKILMFPNDVTTGKAYLLDPAGGPWTTVAWESIGDIDWQRKALDP
jgi:Tol biopolymer transport system component